MIVLSLFDGMACGYEALKRAGIPVTKYYASEICPHAIKVAKKNHPDIVHLGDIENWYMWDIERPDLIIGGSPCQGFSFAGQQLAFDDPRSKLFFDYVAIRDHFQPDFFLLENVRMKKEYLSVISQYMGVEPHFINSALVSAQNRQRFYWYNWDAPDPLDKGLLLKDILQDDFPADTLLDEGQLNRLATSTDIEKRFSVIDPPKAACMTARQYTNWKGTFVTISVGGRVAGFSQTPNGIRAYKNDGRKGSLGEYGTIATPENKSACISTAHVPKVTGGAVRGRYSNGQSGETRQGLEIRKDDKANCLTTRTKDSVLALNEITYRKLSTVECERLQTLPDDYTGGVSNTQRYKMLGNGWTVDVIAHLFRFLPHNLT